MRRSNSGSRGSIRVNNSGLAHLEHGRRGAGSSADLTSNDPRAPQRRQGHARYGPPSKPPSLPQNSPRHRPVNAPTFINGGVRKTLKLRSFAGDRGEIRQVVEYQLIVSSPG